MVSRNERFLVVLIFILWSLGVVVLPYVSNHGLLAQLSDRAQWYWMFAYFLIHAVIFGYVLHMLPPVARAVRRRKKYAWYRASLYAYALCMLVVSMYFIGSQIF